MIINFNPKKLMTFSKTSKIFFFIFFHVQYLYFTLKHFLILLRDEDCTSSKSSMDTPILFFHSITSADPIYHPSSISCCNKKKLRILNVMNLLTRVQNIVCKKKLLNKLIKIFKRCLKKYCLSIIFISTQVQKNFLV